MKPRRFALLIPCCLAAVVAGSLIAADKGEKKSDQTEKENSKSVVYELRTYTTAEGRLPNLHARFRDHTMKLFKKHGMKNVIYMTPTEKKNTLVYLIAHKSRDAAKKSWKAFLSDPDWKKVHADSVKDGPIVTKVESQFLKTTDYSPIK